MDFDGIPFIPGLELSETFYYEAVRPILDQHFPQVSHAAARLDYGSDVLGFDTPQSRDHGWGPKVTLFLSEGDFLVYKNLISETMAIELPVEIRGYPTNYDQPFKGESCLVPIDQGPVRHWVAVVTVQDFFRSYLQVDPTGTLTVIEWLILPPQHLRTIASGKIFHDETGQLSAATQKLRWYPQDVWLYLLANQWRRIDQKEPFIARCGDVGDDLGSQIVASRMVIELMKLCFLMERQFPPYYKWFGTAFGQLDCTSELAPVLKRILDSQNWKQREKCLSDAYQLVMDRHNALGLTPKIESGVSPFFNRPYQVPHAGRFGDALHAAIQSETVRSLPRDMGGVSQFTDSTDILSNPNAWGKLRGIYEG